MIIIMITIADTLIQPSSSILRKWTEFWSILYSFSLRCAQQIVHVDEEFSPHPFSSALLHDQIDRRCEEAPRWPQKRTPEVRNDDTTAR